MQHLPVFTSGTNDNPVFVGFALLNQRTAGNNTTINGMNMAIAVMKDAGGIDDYDPRR